MRYLPSFHVNNNSLLSIDYHVIALMSGENVLATKTLEAMHAKILSFSMLGLIYILLPLGPRVFIQERE